MNLLSDRIPGDGPPPPTGEGVLEALAVQSELRWRSALSALRRAGPDTASAVAARLTATVRLPGGAILPAWPLDEAPLHRLRALLLDPRTSDDDRLNAAQAWLASQPPAIAWVTDDGLSQIAPDGRRTLRAAFANLTNAPVQVALSPEGTASRSSTTVPPEQCVILSTELLATDEPISWARVRTESWSARLGARPAPFVARPPGFPIGPLVPEWDLHSWVSGATPASPPTRTGAALLRRAPGGGWQVYVECRALPGTDPAVQEVVRIHGPGPQDLIEVRRPPSDPASDRWSAVVPLNPAWIDAAQAVRLWVERIDPRGARSTWPGPVLPSEAPTPAMVRLSEWDGWPAIEGTPTRGRGSN